MSACYGRVQGFNRDGGATQAEKTARGHQSVTAQASTHNTEVKATVDRDGEARIEVRRGGRTVAEWNVSEEGVSIVIRDLHRERRRLGRVTGEAMPRTAADRLPGESQ